MIEVGNNKTKPVILIIEDDEQHRGLLNELLQLSGFNTVSAKNGKEGLMLFKNISPDLVLTDIVMPEMDGFEVVQKIISYDDSVPLIAMSGYNKGPKTTYLNMISMLGADAILSKPIKAKKLIDTINESLCNSEKAKKQRRQN